MPSDAAKLRRRQGGAVLRMPGHPLKPPGRRPALLTGTSEPQSGPVANGTRKPWIRECSAERPARTTARSPPRARRFVGGGANFASDCCVWSNVIRAFPCRFRFARPEPGAASNVPAEVSGKNRNTQGTRQLWRAARDRFRPRGPLSGGRHEKAPPLFRGRAIFVTGRSRNIVFNGVAWRPPVSGRSILVFGKIVALGRGQFLKLGFAH